MLQKLVLSLLLIVAFSACTRPGGAGDLSYIAVEGPTMGTVFRVTYADSEGRNFQPELESLLQEINQEVSTYIDSSTISRFNRSESGDLPGFDPAKQNQSLYPHFRTNLTAARDVYQATGGAFDPTVMPLVNYWGFGYTEKKLASAADSLVVDSIMQYIGFDKIRIVGDTLKKEKAGVQLDFSAIAKGYAVDALGRLLETKGVKNYLVDIGGEIRARGLNPKGKVWKIGISLPTEGVSLNAIQTAITVTDRSIATSGNYRNFYEVDGVKYSHTINPKTGYTERNRLLSASVFADECMIADAYATAFMVLGVDSAYELASRLPGVEAYFIYSLEEGLMDVKYTDGLQSLFEKSKTDL